MSIRQQRGDRNARKVSGANPVRIPPLMIFVQVAPDPFHLTVSLITLDAGAPEGLIVALAPTLRVSFINLGVVVDAPMVQDGITADFTMTFPMPINSGEAMIVLPYQESVRGVFGEQIAPMILVWP